MTDYNYTSIDFTGLGTNSVEFSTLMAEVQAAALGSATLVSVITQDSGNEAMVSFDSDLSGPDETALNAVIAAHAGVDSGHTLWRENMGFTYYVIV